MNRNTSWSIIASMLFIGSAMVLSGCTNNSPNNGDQSWLDTYTPVRSLGTGANDFWIDHPIDGALSHPQWINDSFENGCVVFVVHRHTCISCDPQAQRVIALAEKYKDSNLVFYDLDIDLEGDIMMKGYDALIYDPDGPPHYIALTGIFTLIEQDGTIEVGWHAWEGDMTETEIESWMKDAMYYHQKNKGII